MKILFLYAEITGYLMGCLRALRAHPQVSEIRAYQALKLPENDFRPQSETNLLVRDAINRSAADLWPEISAYQPDVVFVSGWMFRKYYQLARRLRKSGAVLIIGNDTPWYGTLRQWMGAVSSPFWLSNVYDYMWVPGAAQATFAKRLGFPPNRIRTGLLSADVPTFGQRQKLPEKKVQTLLSVGSFLPNKGMTRLYRAFNQLLSEGLTGWELHLVGSGPESSTLNPSPHVRITPFVQPEKMPQIFAGADAFALASLKESWGVVVHEAACAGLPMLLSQAVGAATAYLEAEKNGLLFDPQSETDLLKKMRQFLSFSKEEMAHMGACSAALSYIQSPEKWAETLVQMALSGKSGY